jgi:hypothetical protein
MDMKRLAVLLALVLVVPLAQASQKLRYTDEFPGEEVFPCDGFDVVNEGWVRFEVTDYFTNDWEWVKTQIHSTVVDDFWRADDPAGTHLTGTARANHRIAPGKNGHMYWTQAGNALGVTIVIPGYGPLFKDVGRIVFDLEEDWTVVFEAGSRHDLERLNELLCNYFE